MKTKVSLITNNEPNEKLSQTYDENKNTETLLPIKTLSQFIEYYPKLFSQKNFNAWRRLFDDHAMMIKIESSKLSFAIPIDEAMPEQIEYGNDNDTFLEKWDCIESHIYNNIAVVKANYQLMVDSEIREGVDVVTLFWDKDTWHILSLVYEETKHITQTTSYNKEKK